jgi:hypothetical protein
VVLHGCSHDTQSRRYGRILRISRSWNHRAFCGPLCRFLSILRVNTFSVQQFLPDRSYLLTHDRCWLLLALYERKSAPTPGKIDYSSLLYPPSCPFYGGSGRGWCHCNFFANVLDIPYVTSHQHRNRPWEEGNGLLSFTMFSSWIPTGLSPVRRRVLSRSSTTRSSAALRRPYLPTTNHHMASGTFVVTVRWN